MAVSQELDSDVTAETKIDEIDGGDTTCIMVVEIEKGVPSIGKLPPETTVERWVADSGCSQFMTPSADYMVNYREVGGILRIADGRAMPIEGIGNFLMSFWSDKDCVQLVLPNVAHVPLLGYILLSLKRMTDRGHKYIGEKKGVPLHLKNGKTLFGPSVGKLNYFSGFRRPLDSSNPALATIATGKIPSVSPVDINTFHTSRGHVHEKSLRSTAKQLGVVIEGSFREREGCSVAKGLGKPIGRTTSTRADKVILNLGSVVYSRNVIWARLPPSVPVSAEKVRSVSVARKGEKLDPSHYGEVEMDEDVVRDKSSESTGVRPRVTAHHLTPTPATTPCGRAAPAGDRGTAVATALRGAARREIPGTPVYSSAGTLGVLLCLRPL